ncbi:hypothetical protein INT48_006538 [Thamnidium elegans]|uniref:Uncharacterized protein n=1 Tax=Thamnidium elegans TaxID=101142 RepID=A0A8H7STW6_9FUNG|nr:hypothetical protein INT48_006538 [Thamnidium elegans]
MNGTKPKNDCPFKATQISLGTMIDPRQDSTRQTAAPDVPDTFVSYEESTQPAIVKEAEATTSGTESKSVNLEKFTRYVETRATVSSTLYGYYGNESQKPTEVYFLSSFFEFRVDGRCNLYYGNLFVAKILGFFPQPERESDNHSFKLQLLTNDVSTTTYYQKIGRSTEK